jgi:hypothetical protein
MIETYKPVELRIPCINITLGHDNGVYKNATPACMIEHLSICQVVTSKKERLNSK